MKSGKLKAALKAENLLRSNHAIYVEGLVNMYILVMIHC